MLKKVNKKIIPSSNPYKPLPFAFTIILYVELSAKNLSTFYITILHTMKNRTVATHTNIVPFYINCMKNLRKLPSVTQARYDRGLRANCRSNQLRATKLRHLTPPVPLTRYCFYISVLVTKYGISNKSRLFGEGLN